MISFLRVTTRMVGLAAMAALLAGCSKPKMPLSVTVSDPPPVRKLSCQFSQAYYQPAERGTLTAALVGIGDKAGAPSRETMVVELMWRPNPGVTFSHPTGTSARITYIVDLAGSSLVFDGAGFVRIWENKQQTELLAEIQSSTLHLRSHPGVLEPSMRKIAIAGTFRARKNAVQTVENHLKVKQYMHRPDEGTPLRP